MKRLKRLITIIMSMLFCIPVYADEFVIDVPTGIDKTLVNNDFLNKFSGLQSFWGTVATIAIGIMIFVSVISFSIAAFKYAKGGDDSKSKKEAMHNFTVLGTVTAILGGFPMIIYLLIVLLGAV